MRSYPRIRLADDELSIGVFIGLMRQRCSQQYADRFDSPDPMETHPHGACGEIAIAKYVRGYWSGVRHKAPDVITASGIEIEVRTRRPTTVPDDDLTLRIKLTDPDSRLYVLVISRFPEFEVRGWIYGSEGKQARYIREHYRKAIAESKAYQVPQAALHPAEELESEPRGRVYAEAIETF